MTLVGTTPGPRTAPLGPNLVEEGPATPVATARARAARATTNLVNQTLQNDTVDTQTGHPGTSTKLDTPVLPAGEGTPTSDTARNFTAFVNVVSELNENLTAPGALAAIGARIGGLQTAANDSITQTAFTPAQVQQIGQAVSDQVQQFVTNFQPVLAQLPPDVQSQVKQIAGAAAQNTPTALTVLLGLEASADYAIMVCTAISNLDNKKNSDLLGALLQTAQQMEQAKEQQINANSMNDLDKIADAAAKKDAGLFIGLLSALIVVAIVIVAVVGAIAGVFTGSTGAWAAAGLIAVMVGALISLWQRLPAILDACGAHDAADQLRKFNDLPGVHWTMFATQIAAAIVSIVCTFGASAGTVAQAAGQQAASQAAEQLGTDLANQGQALSQTATDALKEALQKAVQESVQKAMQEGAFNAQQAVQQAIQTAVQQEVQQAIAQGAKQISQQVAQQMTQQIAQSVAQNVVSKLSSDIAQKAAAMLVEKIAHITSSILSVGQAGLNMAGAVVDHDAAMDQANLDELQALSKEMMAMVTYMKSQTSDLQQALTDVMTMATEMQQKFVQALESLAQAQTVAIHKA